MELKDILQYLGIVVGILAIYFLIRVMVYSRHKKIFLQQKEDLKKQKLQAELEHLDKKEMKRLEPEEFEHLKRELKKFKPELFELLREEIDRIYDLQRYHREDISSRKLESEPVQFHALWHRYSHPEVWQTLLVYIFSGFVGLRDAQRDFMRRRTAPTDFYSDSSSMARRHIRKGTQISIYPELNGFRFNPPFCNVLLLENMHCIEFRMQALPEASSIMNMPIEGRVAFYVGPILIGETRLFAIVSDKASHPHCYPANSLSNNSFWEETYTSPYRSIFVSYSHEDSHIVDQLELAYHALGDDYLRDISVLRSGEQWNAALLSKIDSANIFQLCWSQSAKQSPYVEEEWRHALSLQRQNFIRPIYWQLPMPIPPEELGNIHFAYIRISEESNQSP